MAYSLEYTFTPPARTVTLTKKLVRDTLAEVRDRLLIGEINGHKNRLKMDVVCQTNAKCGTAACIGGWAGILLVGAENAHGLFDRLIDVDRATDPKYHTVGRDRLWALFHEYEKTLDYNEPNVAATAIQRYLDGNKEPWPRGKMPDRLRYRYRRKAKAA